LHALLTSAPCCTSHSATSSKLRSHATKNAVCSSWSVSTRRRTCLSVSEIDQRGQQPRTGTTYAVVFVDVCAELHQHGHCAHVSLSALVPLVASVNGDVKERCPQPAPQWQRNVPGCADERRVSARMLVTAIAVAVAISVALNPVRVQALLEPDAYLVESPVRCKGVQVIHRQLRVQVAMAGVCVRREVVTRACSHDVDTSEVADEISESLSGVMEKTRVQPMTS
jgi:hypothetical protein